MAMEIVEPRLQQPLNNLYFKHVTRSQDTFKMTSLTQTRKIHVPVGPWIFMVSIVRTAGNCEVWVLASLTRSYTIEGVDSH